MNRRFCILNLAISSNDLLEHRKEKMMPASVILATLSYLTVPLGIISTTVRINISCTGLEDTPEDENRLE
jgi:hypothetical protein